MPRHVTYGPGGFDPGKPNNNIVSDEHVPAPPDEDVRARIEGQLDSAVANLRAYVNDQAPTNVATVATVKLLCRVVLNLARLARNQFDGSD